MWQELSQEVESTAAQQKMFKMAKQMRKDQKDLLGFNFIKDAGGTIKVEPAEVQERWRGYFEDLLNRENQNILEEIPAVYGPLRVMKAEVSLALKRMKRGKASGSSEFISEMFKIADQGSAMLCSVFNNIMRNDITPDKWAESITIPLYKGKGDDLECGK